MKKALITGVNGQDGSYLAEFLLEKGYDVYGMLRRSSVNTAERIENLLDENWIDKMKYTGRIHFVYGDMTDSLNVVHLIKDISPDEIYNLAAQSHVAVSFQEPEYTANADGVGILRILEAIRILGLEKKTRVYQASTSELFGKVEELIQTETTPFHPRSPYAVAKMYAYWITKLYREAYGMFVCNGILFNHESERRGETFVTRKITLAAAKIAQGKQAKLYLGNLSAKRDWGYAKDYVECMWKMLQHSEADDFVIATGETHTVREFCTLAFQCAGIHLKWQGEGMDEKGIEIKTGKVLVEVSKEFFRPADVEMLHGNPHKAQSLLNWSPTKTSFQQLVSLMVESDMKFVQSRRGLDIDNEKGEYDHVQITG